MKSPLSIAVLAGVALACSAAQADTGKLLLTGGVSTIAGSAGGGLTPWAVIGSNATEGEVGVSAYATRAATQDYSLNGYGVALGLHDRLELSLARQDFDASPAIALNGIAPFGVTPGQHIKMDVLGIKLKVAGDAVLNSDSWMPQIAVGLEHKQVHPGSIRSVLDFLGTKTSGTDVYVSATKLLLRGYRMAEEKGEASPLEELSEREREVLALTAEGYSSSEIGKKLFISPKTVDTYRSRLTQKLGLSHRSDLVRFALRTGVLKVG